MHCKSRYGPATVAVALDMAQMSSNKARVNAHRHVDVTIFKRSSKIGKLYGG